MSRLLDRLKAGTTRPAEMAGKHSNHAPTNLPTRLPTHLHVCPHVLLHALPIQLRYGDSSGVTESLMLTSVVLSYRAIVPCIMNCITGPILGRVAY